MRHKGSISENNELCASSLFDSSRKRGTLYFERNLARAGYRCVAGLDEAGRGPLAGPVVAGCVVLPRKCEYKLFKDSKLLTAGQRENLFQLLHTCGAKVGYGIITPEEIDRINILQASLRAMALAVDNLARQCRINPDFLLVDGTFTAPVNLPQRALIKGESKSASIGAASIIAKVMRDRLMEDFHSRYPLYNFSQNKGYATLEHRRAIRKHGPCVIHRRTFSGVKEYLERMNEGEPSGSQQSLF
ncbi:MAG: ribonuclease HII [Desulfobulbaceae bacterium]|nr:ribonuclease HII [Desulfobulbaceae bacterium]